MVNLHPITLRPEQWSIIISLIEEKQSSLNLKIKNLEKSKSKDLRNLYADMEEILIDIADQHTPEDEEE